MACKDCEGDCKTNIQMPCKACILIDNDHTIKRACYCDLCKQYLCKPCFNNEVRRARAVFINVAEKVADVPVIGAIAEVVSSVLKSKKGKKSEEEKTNDVKNAETGTDS